MCCLFGLIDYGHSLSRGERNRILTILSTACEVRGNGRRRNRLPQPGPALYLQASTARPCHGVSDSRGRLGGDGAHPHDHPGE